MNAAIKRQYAESKRQAKHQCFLHLLYLALCLLTLFNVQANAQEQKDNEVVLDNDLIFSENWFNDLAAAKANPEKVLYLDLSLKKYKTFPREILTFKNVEQLYLSYNYWTSIPDSISTLSKLKIIDITGNYYLNYLPREALSQLPQLEKLIVKDNKLAPGEVEKIKKLLPATEVVTD